MPGTGFYNQQLRYDEYRNAAKEGPLQMRTQRGELAWYEQQYNDWKEFTEDLVWFDTAACMTEGGINRVIYRGSGHPKECYTKTEKRLIYYYRNGYDQFGYDTKGKDRDGYDR